MIHGCNLRGSLPKDVTFNALTTMSVFNNRLSCPIPPEMAPHIRDVMVLPSNLFSYDPDADDWMSSSFFLTSYSLFLSPWEITKNYAEVSIALLMTLVVVFIIVAKHRSPEHRSNAQNDLEHVLIDSATPKRYGKDVNSVNTYFVDKWLLVLFMVLSVVYYAGSSYFECALFADQWGLAYYFQVLFETIYRFERRSRTSNMSSD